MKRLVLAALALSACDSPDLKIRIVTPGPSVANLFSSVATTQLSVMRNGATIAVSGTHSATSPIDLSGVPYDSDTVFDLEGKSKSGDTIAHGRTCPVSFTKDSGTIPLYFAPVNYFGPTAAAPTASRTGAAAGILDDGTVIVAGGDTTSAVGTPLDTSDIYTAGVTTFAAGPTMLTPRAYAVGVSIPGVGFIATGGVDASGAAIPSNDLYIASQGKFETASATVARVDHQSLLLSTGYVLSIGGRSSLTAKSALDTSDELVAFSDGSYSNSSGPKLSIARYGHAAVAVGGVVYVFGGFDSQGKALDSIELCDQLAPGDPCTVLGTTLSKARGYATASVTSDGSVLVIGGSDTDGAPITGVDSANLYNRDARTVATKTMVTSRYHHTATVLADGTILISGGQTDVAGTPTDNVELYNSNGDFVSVGNNLNAARLGHIAVTSCDDTVLFAGGDTSSTGATAELFTPASYTAATE